nr:DNA-directed RNA polymerase subunit delta [Caldalkalibacillus salinus]
MVDIAYHILKENNKEPKPYLEILEEIVEMKGFKGGDKAIAMTRLYTEINIDGRFKPVGDNVWGLRSWYPVEQAEEIVITETKKKKKKKKKADDEFLEEDVEGIQEIEEEIEDVGDLADDFEEDLEGIEDVEDLDEDLEEDEEEDLAIDDNEEDTEKE